MRQIPPLRPGAAGGRMRHPRRAVHPLPAGLRRRLSAPHLPHPRPRHRHGLPAHAGDFRTGHRLRPASGLADAAARNRLGRLSQHHRRGLLSRRPSQPRRLPLRPHPRSPHLQRRRRPARRRHHPRHRHGLRRRRAARSGPLPHRGAGAPRIPAQNDRHRAALPAGPLLRRAGGAQRRAAGPAFHLLPRSPSRSSWARPAMAACS